VGVCGEGRASEVLRILLLHRVYYEVESESRVVKHPFRCPQVDTAADCKAVSAVFNFG
jgi:hypothetical protein